MTSNEPKAFLFDLDGVIVDSEPLWDEAKARITDELFGTGTAERVGIARGLSMDGVFEFTINQLGKPELAVHKVHFIERFREEGNRIYQVAPTSNDLPKLIHGLHDAGYRLGVVSASPARWIEAVMRRVPGHEHIQLVVSLEDRHDLNHKPSPDGYVFTMHKLGVLAARTVVLEDSNAGIASAKAAGAHTIGYQEHLSPGYELAGANAFAESMRHVATLMTNHKVLRLH